MNPPTQKSGPTPPATWIITSVLALVAMLYFLFGFLPSQKVMSGLQHQLLEKHQAVSLMDVQALQQQSLEAQLVSVQNYGVNWRKSALKPGAMAATMARISQEAKAANVSILRLEPQKHPLELHSIRPVTLAVAYQGTFADSFDFIRRLESLPLPLWIQNLHLSQTGEAAGLIRTEMTLTIFANSPDYSDK